MMADPVFRKKDRISIWPTARFLLPTERAQAPAERPARALVPRKSDLDTPNEGEEGYFALSVQPMRLPITMSPGRAFCYVC